MENKYTKDFLKGFGKNLVIKRKEKGFSQEVLSFEADLDVMTISRIERGLLNISIGNVYKIASALSIHYKELFDFELPLHKK
ncbi:MAG: helix-turn-helix transcriptional regulator [Bacteroidota bacterium]